MNRNNTKLRVVGWHSSWGRGGAGGAEVLQLQQHPAFGSREQQAQEAQGPGHWPPAGSGQHVTYSPVVSGGWCHVFTDGRGSLRLCGLKGHCLRTPRRVPGPRGLPIREHGSKQNT